MFLTKEDFQESIDLMETYENISTEGDIKISTAEYYAREIFEDFDQMLDDSKQEIIEMIIEDISIRLYSIN